MLNKISNLKLVLGLVILGLVYLATVYFDSSKSEELEKQLVSIDTANVTEIIIVSPDETVNLTREGQHWEVQLNTGKKVPAVTGKVKSLVNELINIQPDRLAAKEKSKWKDYQVDSTGTTIQVKEHDNLTLNMVTGHSGSTSYIRLADETEVYASDGFGGLKNHGDINHYRDNTFVKITTDSIQSITFRYPGDSSFQLINESGSWSFADGSPADSTKTIEYLRNLNLRYNHNFSDQDGSSLGESLAEISISAKNEADLILKAYIDPADSVVYQSSSNPTALFNDKELGETFFVGKASFSKSGE